MSIPENIKNLANKVRTAIYGKDVRESIAKSMEETGNIADEAKNTASDAYDITQNLLDESFDTSVINQNFEQRLDNEISNLQPEWTGFKDGVTAQLAQTLLKQAIPTGDNLYELVAYDTFDSNSNFEFFDMVTYADTTPWTVLNNIITASTGANPTIALLKDAEVSDGKVQLIIENPVNTLADGNWCGVVLRTKKRNDFIMVNIHGNGENCTIKVWRYNGAYTQITSKSVVNEFSKITTGSKLNLEVECVGDKIIVYLNGRAEITHTNSIFNQFSFGRCGIVSNHTYGWKFSNFAITKRKYDKIQLKDLSKVLCIGSSITYGYGVTTPYPGRLKTKLRELGISEAIVINGGISGNTTTQMKDRLQALLTTHNPKIIIIETSVNDTKSTEGFSFEKTIGNMTQMIQMVKSFGAIPLITTISTINPAVTGDINNQSYHYTYQLNARIRILGRQQNIRVVDNAYAFNNNLSLLGDFVHPNDNGAEVMAQNTLDVLTI